MGIIYLADNVFRMKTSMDHKNLLKATKGDDWKSDYYLSESLWN